MKTIYLAYAEEVKTLEFVDWIRSIRNSLQSIPGVHLLEQERISVVRADVVIAITDKSSDELGLLLYMRRSLHKPLLVFNQKSTDYIVERVEEFMRKEEPFAETIRTFC
jgi:hypothetical protein